MALGAIDTEGKLTNPVGKSLSRLPVDPCLGKILVTASEMGCAEEALYIVAMAASDSVFSTSR